MSKYDWLLFLHVTGAFSLVGGSVTAAVFTITARRRERPSEIALLLGLVRIALPFIYAGVASTLVFGLWLVRAAGQGYSFGDAWSSRRSFSGSSRTPSAVRAETRRRRHASSPSNSPRKETLRARRCTQGSAIRCRSRSASGAV